LNKIFNSLTLPFFLNHAMKPSFLPACLAACLFAAASIGTAPAQQMNYQGRLTDSSGAPRPGPQATIAFSIWTAATAGTQVWGPFTINADLIDGRFSVKLGDSAGRDGSNRTLSAAFSNPAGPRYLELKVGTDAPLPRQQILAAPTALFATHATHATTSDTAANFTSVVLKTDEINQRVGIGTSTPVAPLGFASSLGGKISLHGTSSANFGFGIQSNLMQIHTNAATADIAFGYGTSAAMTETMRIKGSGNVGIGTMNPGGRLEIQGGADAGGGNNPVNIALAWRGGGYRHFISSRHSPVVNSNGNAIDFYLNASNSAFGSVVPGTNNIRVMSLSGDGRVGIGTDEPIAPLHVMGGSFPPYLLAAVVEAGGFGPYPLPYPERNKDTDPPASLRAFSIVSDKGVLAHNFDVKSDERIKNIVAPSDSAADLATMLAIRITDYTFKDVIGSGSVSEKKVIAQQLETIFPQAVTRSTNSVPDIYKRALTEDGWVKLATDLKPGERVRLVGLKGEGTHVVLEVADDGFRADFTPDGAEVFVFGREVNDFRSVDYDAIAMLNVSATQQIKREKDAEVKALREENALLRTRIAALETSGLERDAKIAAIEKLLETPESPGNRTVSIRGISSAR